MPGTTTTQPTTSALHRFGPLAMLAVVATQLALAGAGAFGAPSWSMHVMLGMLIAVLATVGVVAALVTRPGRAIVVGSIAVGALALLQPMLSVLAERVNPWFGTLHALGAVALVATLVAVVVTSRRS